MNAVLNRALRLARLREGASRSSGTSLDRFATYSARGDAMAASVLLPRRAAGVLRQVEEG